ncbi:MAG: 3'-5' exonuclease [Candidatus Omnitrophota bacterium]
MFKLERPLVILDLETTGTWREKDKIVELGMIKYHPDGTLEEYVRRVNPGMHIPEGVVRIHGITDDDVKEKPSFKEIAEEAISFMAECDLAGFNVERFDLPILEREFHAAGIRFDWQQRSIYDAQRIYHYHERRDLKAAYNFYCGKELESAHSALDDARATMEILSTQVVKYAGEGREIEALRAFRDETGGKYFDEDRKFGWWNGELYPTFGKYSFKSSLKELVQKDRPYLKWMLSSDFKDKVKRLIQDALKGEFPEGPK